jgi:hypothetical protein
MSTALAIASVTQVLRDLLNNGLIDHDVTGVINGNVNVTSLPPDLVVTSTDEQAQLNLFMYHATPNQGWRNEHFPSVNSAGNRVSNPPLALNLHYLLTAYCSNELHTEILLGYGMQLLHENPVLSRDAIKRSLALPSSMNGTGLPLNLQSLATSKLAEQVELIKIIPETLNADELSKLWTAFQSKFRPSAAYLASVVLIESTKSTKSALPVKEPRIYVRPFKQPVITRVKSQANAGAPILLTGQQKILQGYRLVIEGYNLNAENIRIIIDGIDGVPGPLATDISESQIIYQLPDYLPSGIHGVQVASQINMGSPEVLHQGFASNTEAFVLSPRIDPASVETDNLEGTGDEARSADIGITVAPPIGEDQSILFLMNRVDNPPGTVPEAYSFKASVDSSPPGPAENIIIPIGGVKAGSYLIRIRVDGAESPLGVDGNGKYNSPLLVIP